MRIICIAITILMFATAGCSTMQAGSAAKTVATIARTAPELAHQFDAVYAYLVGQKLVPDHLGAATSALAAMDAVAPIVQRGAEALHGDAWNWASFILQSAITVAQIMGYVLAV